MAYLNKICGIYKISLKGSNKVYIGLTNNFAQRKNEHIKALKGNKHFNIHLQRAFVKYGEESFLMELLEECDLCDLNEREKYYILKFNSFNDGFNLTTGGERFSISDDVKKRISEKHKGKVVKESTRQKLREINIGKKMTQEVKDKISFLNKNRILTYEQREKISKAAKFERTPEMRKKQSISHMGKVISEETKLKLAAFNLKRVRPNSVIEILDGKVYIDGFEYIKGKRTPLEQEAFLVAKSIRMKEARRKASISNKGKKRSQETKDKISRGNKGLKRTTEQNIANSERQKGKKQSEDFKQKLRDYNTKKRQQKWDASQH
jgi:group I intron endonuclease